MSEYFKCENCGQVVQGFNAMQQIDCCERPRYERIDGPESDEPPEDEIRAMQDRLYDAGVGYGG